MNRVAFTLALACAAVSSGAPAPPAPARAQDEADGHRVSGIVVDDTGAPVDAFTVRARPVGSGRGAAGRRTAIAEAVSDGEGRFELTGLQAGRWELTAAAEGHATGRPLRLTVPDGGAELSVTCARLGAVAGRVYDLDGRPLAGASVAAFEHTGRRRLGESGKDGAFRVVGLPPGPARLVASADALADSEPVWAEVRPGRVTDGFELALQLGGTVAGQVHPSLGRTGARRAVIQEVSGTPVRRVYGVRRRLPGDMTREAPITDRRFEWTGLAPGTYAVCMEWRYSSGWIPAPDGSAYDWIDAYANRQEEVVEVVRGVTTHVVLGADTGDKIRVVGTVRDHGEPLGRCPIHVYFSSGPYTHAVTNARTNLDGVFDVSLPQAGDYSFVLGNGWTYSAHTIPTARLVELSFDMPTAVIRGVVLGPDGEPEPEHRLLLSLQDAPPSPKWLGERWGRTNAEGCFEFRGLSPDRYSLRTGGFGAPSPGEDLAIEVLQDLRVTEGSPLELQVRLERAAVVEGRVRYTAGGSAAGIRVGARYAGGSELAIRPDEHSDFDGLFRLRQVSPGRVTVYAEHPDGRTSEVEVEAVRGEVATVELVLP